MSGTRRVFQQAPAIERTIFLNAVLPLHLCNLITLRLRHRVLRKMISPNQLFKNNRNLTRS